MDVLEGLRSALDGELLTPGGSRYDDAQGPRIARFRDVHPRALVRCSTVEDVVRSVEPGPPTGWTPAGGTAEEG